MATSTRRSVRVGRLVTGAAGLLSLAASLLATSPAHAQFGFGAVAFAPTPGVILDGVALNVTPIVSADRRYVRMTMTPYFNAVQGFETFVVPAAVSGGGVGIGGIGGIPGLGGLGGVGGLGGGGQGGFGSVGPGALGAPTVLRNVGTPRQALAAGPSVATDPMVASAVNDPLASAYAQATAAEPAVEQGTPVVAGSRSSAARDLRSSRTGGDRRPAAPRQRTVRQP